MRPLLCCLALATPAFAADLQVRPEGAVLHLTADDKPLADYQMQPGDVPAGVNEVFKHGAHLHPVYTPSGKIVTGNHPPDHRWHRGIWMAWTKTEFGSAHPDFWNQGKGDGKDKSAASVAAEIRFEAVEKTFAADGKAGFTSRHRFIDHSTANDVDVLKETWDVTATQQTFAGRVANVIDLTSTQTCASDIALKLPTYHYGGLGVRGNAAWDPEKAVQMLTSEGHDRKKGDSTKGRWVTMTGDVDGAPAGLAVLIHPTNFRAPQPLRLNPKNPQLCIAPSQDGDWSIEPGKPYVSKYRIVAFDGAPDAAWIEARWAEWAKQ